MGIITEPRENLFRATLSRRGPRQPLAAATKFRIRHWCQPPRGRQRGRAPFSDYVCACVRARVCVAVRGTRGTLYEWNVSTPSVAREAPVCPTCKHNNTDVSIHQVDPDEAERPREMPLEAPRLNSVRVCTHTHIYIYRPSALFVRPLFYFSRPRQPSARLFKRRLESRLYASPANLDSLIASAAASVAKNFWESESRLGQFGAPWNLSVSWRYCNYERSSTINRRTVVDIGERIMELLILKEDKNYSHWGIGLIFVNI